MPRSRGAVGTSADNAAAEAFNATLKREVLQGARHWPDSRTARMQVFRWITRYNTRRRHSRLGHTSPINYENDPFGAGWNLLGSTGNRVDSDVAGRAGTGDNR